MPAPWSREVDVVVVGSGVAGLSTALGLAGARSVLVLSRGAVDDGSTAWAQGGVASAVDEADDPGEHAADTAVAGAGRCDPDALRCLVEEGPQRLAELVAAGARFDRDGDGRLELTREGGHGRRRIVHAGGDATGREVARALAAAVRRAGVEVVEHARVTALTRVEALDGPRVTGVRVELGAGREPGVVSARAVVLATGGLGHAYAASTNPAGVAGDGLSLALRAGAALSDVEFVQFHPTVLVTGSGQSGQLALVSEALRGEGAVLLDGAGRPVMAGRHPLGDLAPRDVVARGIVDVLERDGVDSVRLDATGLRDVARRFPTVTAACARAGIDPATEPIPVAPAQHFLCGGVRTDRWGATGVPGLYAVGEVAATGVHGANRLASNSLLEGLVFGRRVASRLVLDLPASAGGAALPDPVPVTDPAPDAVVRRVLSAHAGVRRSGPGLEGAVELLSALPATALRDVGLSVTSAALARTESRGCHWRSDHPAARDSWRRPVVVRLGADGLPGALPHPAVRPTRTGAAA